MWIVSTEPKPLYGSSPRHGIRNRSSSPNFEDNLAGCFIIMVDVMYSKLEGYTNIISVCTPRIHSNQEPIRFIPLKRSTNMWIVSTEPKPLYGSSPRHGIRNHSSTPNFEDNLAGCFIIMVDVMYSELEGYTNIISVCTSRIHSSRQPIRFIPLK
ncbi:hypothetical protein B9Z55_025620 [Caenorhabditis nigoni]|nr:hypothetical protein B9Z55_025620 [Caenorhabditis nigoni]